MSDGLHVEVRGRGPALVLLHGWAMHAGVFEPLTVQLAATHTLHLVDLPGHGRSRDAGGLEGLDAVVGRLLERLPPAPWLGWSLGGLIALSAALRAPRQVTGVVALCASPRFVRAADWPHAVETEVFARFASGLAADYRGTVDRFLALEAHGSERMREELRRLRQQVFSRGEPAPEVLGQGLALLAQTDLRGALPQLAVPSLWIGGRRDRLVPWQAMQAAARACPRGRFLRLDGAGHAPFLSHAEELAQALAAWPEGDAVRP